MFEAEVKRAALVFKAMLRERCVKVLTHYDADGLCAGAIVIKALLREGVGWQFRVLKQITPNCLEVSAGDALVLTDLGSGYLDVLKSAYELVPTFVLDHHKPQPLQHPNLFHLNPLLHGADAPASAVSYLFAKHVNPCNADCIDLAIVGAIGDEYKFEEGLCAKLLHEAKELGALEVSYGLKLYGRTSKPIHTALEQSFDPLIPGITGSESQAVQFLTELGIQLKEGNKWRTLAELSLEEQRKLASAIIRERLKLPELNAPQIFGELYTLLHRPKELSDAREFATLLNACGRLKRYELALQLCFDTSAVLDEAQGVLNEYRHKLCNYLNWLKAGNYRQTERATYVLGIDCVEDTLIGTLISTALHSNLLPNDRPVFGLASTNGKVKVSARKPLGVEMELGTLLQRAVQRVGGIAGGHAAAAGGLIQRDKVEEFIQALEAELEYAKGV